MAEAPRFTLNRTETHESDYVSRGPSAALSKERGFVEGFNRALKVCDVLAQLGNVDLIYV